LEKIGDDLGIDEEYYEIPLKDIGTYYEGFETSLVRTYVEAYNNGAQDVACPWEYENDPMPGACALGVDSNLNNICDYSE